MPFTWGWATVDRLRREGGIADFDLEDLADLVKVRVRISDSFKMADLFSLQAKFDGISDSRMIT